MTDYSEIRSQLEQLRKDIAEVTAYARRVSKENLQNTRLSLGLPDGSLQPDPNNPALWRSDPWLGRVVDQAAFEQWKQDQLAKQAALDKANDPEPPALDDSQETDQVVHAKSAMTDSLAAPQSNVGRYWQPSRFDPFSGLPIEGNSDNE